MAKVTLRELKENAPAIVRKVEEESAIYSVTLDGDLIAVLEPQERVVDPASLSMHRQRREELTQLIEEFWTSDLSSLELLSIERGE